MLTKALMMAIVIVTVAAGWFYNKSATLELQLATVTGQQEACNRTLSLLAEGRDIDNAIPDNLDGFDIPPEWLLGPVE